MRTGLYNVHNINTVKSKKFNLYDQFSYISRRVLSIFLKTTSQVSTFQMCNFPSGNFTKVRLGPLSAPDCNGKSATTGMNLCD